MASDEPPAKRQKLDFLDDFKVIVGAGDDTTTYSVNKYFLTKSSKFLKRACNGDWREGRTKTINLPETETGPFEIYLQLLYTGQVVATEENAVTRSSDAVEITGLHKELCSAYLLADMLLDSHSKNAIMDHLIAKVREIRKFPSAKTTHFIYDNTAGGSFLRRLMVDYLACDLDNSGPSDVIPKYPAQLLFELSVKLTALNKENKRPLDPSQAPKCTYHEHDEANPECT